MPAAVAAFGGEIDRIEVLLCGVDRLQFVDASKLRSGFEVATAQGDADSVELFNICQVVIRRPVAVGFDLDDIDLRREAAFVHEFDRRSRLHRLRVLKSGSHSLGSGLYAVTKTAGP